MPFLFLAFLAIPLIEIYLLIEVGAQIGAEWTIAAVVATAVIGAALVRRQGLKTLSNLRSSLNAGETPALVLLEGAILLIAGALLLTPGFFTDALGFACLIPPLRRRAIRGWLERVIVLSPGGRTRASQGDMVEGEFRRLDD